MIVLAIVLVLFILARAAVRVPTNEPLRLKNELAWRLNVESDWR